MPASLPRPRLLLHACCAPCATVPFARLGGEYQITVFFYGPNIHPRGEYELRLADQRRLCEQESIPLIEGDYRPADWGRAIRTYRRLPEGSGRCQACFRLRMEATARLARERDFDFFTVTLSVSRHKDSRILTRIGKQVAAETGVAYLPEDFKKQNGYQLSVQCSQERKLRRQDYCGCSLSLSEAIVRRSKRRAGNSRQEAIGS